MTHKYSRAGGMSEQERAKTRMRLAGGKIPNASGARAEAPQILASSEPSRELQSALTPEQEEVAAKNRATREAHRAAQAASLREADTQNTPSGEPEPTDDELLDREVTGETDEFDTPDDSGDDTSGDSASEQSAATIGSSGHEVRDEG